MKSYLFLISALLVCLAAGNLAAQSKKTIILVRHAEKDAPQSEMSDDPDLSAAGKQRAERLAKITAKYRLGAVFSSDTKRTRQTAEPAAKHRHLQIQIYDPRKDEDLVKQVMASRTKRFLIVGHSNTIPALANLFIKKELFKSLDDSEYGTIWLIRITKGQVKSVNVLSY